MPVLLRFTVAQTCDADGGRLELTSLSGGPSTADYLWRVVDSQGTDFGSSILSGTLPNASQLADDTYEVSVEATDGPDTYYSVKRTVEVSCAPVPPGGGGGGGGGGTNPPPVVPGCMDPDADNYDPTATQDNGSCLYAPRLTLAAPLPELAPVGVPLTVVLNSAPVAGAAPAPATVLVDLSALPAPGASPGLTASLRVDGYLFTYGPLIVPGRFADAGSLLAALQAQPALAASYLLTQPTATTLRITARAPGLPATPTVVAGGNVLTSIVLTATPGVVGLHSQRRLRWGCYLEVWAGCGSVFGGVVTKATAVLAQRLPLDYRADNLYSFDVAPALSQYTGHAYPLADGSCPDRLVSYFVRYGEEYADPVSGLRTARTLYESAIAWGIEAMELPAPVGGAYLLSTRPGPWAVAVGDRVPAWLLSKPNIALRTVVRYRLATSRATTDYLPSHLVAIGQVTQANDRLRVAAGALSGELLLRDAVLDTETSFAKLVFGATGQLLTFANRQGGFDAVYFDGTADPSSKRTAAGFTNSAGPQQLTAEVALPTRLTTGLLDFATWDWLRRELGSSPAAWLETSTGAVPVRLADVVPDGDPITGNYSLYVDYETSPVRGLSN